MMSMKIIVPDQSEKDLFFSGSESESACVGHLRMDFDSTGKSFHSTWFIHNPNLKVLKFVGDLRDVIDELRHSFLRNRQAMQNFMSRNNGLLLGDRGIGVKAETDGYAYYFRCSPTSGDYDCYCYCYDKKLLEYAMAEEENMEMGGISQ